MVDLLRMRAGDANRKKAESESEKPVEPPQPP